MGAPRNDISDFFSNLLGATPVAGNRLDFWQVS
jgi:hypothetical protein